MSRSVDVAQLLLEQAGVRTMRGSRWLATASVLAAAVAGNQAVRADTGPPAPVLQLDPTRASAAAQRLLDSLSGAPITVARDAAGIAHSVSTASGHLVPLPAGVSGAPEAMARAHLDRLAPLFGLRPTSDLVLEPRAAGLRRGPGQDLIVRFQQVRAGLPVIGADLTVVMNAHGALRSVTGLATPLAGDGTPATVDADNARRIATAAVAQDHPRADPQRLRAAAAKRWFLDPKLVGLPAQWHIRPTAVWWVEVSDGGLVGESVLVDSHTGAVPFGWNTVEAGYREVCDGRNTIDSNPKNDATGNSQCTLGTAVRREGQAPTGTTEVDNAYDKGGATADWYQHVGVDLTELIGTKDAGENKAVRSTARYCPNDGECVAGLLSNAFWNGNGMYYGDGWTGAQDIVSHELTHGVTQNTSHLLYFYQSGAINESMSDVFGEIVQRSQPNFTEDNWAIGEQSPLTQLRSMKNPGIDLGGGLGLQPDNMTSSFYNPDLAYTDNGAVHTNSGVGNKTAYLLGETGTESFNGQTVTGIGLARTATLYFRVENMLASGAQYADLGYTLYAACTGLVGQKAYDGSTFSSGDCAAVAAAVNATRMSSQPGGSAKTVDTPQANYCPSGRKQSNVVYDGFENLSTRTWQLGSVWELISDYAVSGKKSMYGVEPSSAVNGSYSSALTRKSLVSIPKNSHWLEYLRFAHQYRLSGGILNGPYYDGAVVEYRVNGTGSWQSLSGRNWQNGPTTRITPKGASSYTGFGGNSAGYRSSKVDISFLRGKKVQFRWRLIWDGQSAVDGWTLDDLRVFTCK